MNRLTLLNLLTSLDKGAHFEYTKGSNIVRVMKTSGGFFIECQEEKSEAKSHLSINECLELFTDFFPYGMGD